MKKTKNYILALLPVILISCHSAKFEDENLNIDASSVKIAKFQIRQVNVTYIFDFKQKDSLKSLISDLNKSPYDGQWKGNKWDKIYLVKAKDTIILFTNGKVFGKSNSGRFYKLDKKYRPLFEVDDVRFD